MDIELLQVTRVLMAAVLAFLVALGITPLVTSFLKHYQFNKQIRAKESAPIFSQLHQKKAGTPTGGGIIIWGTVVGIAAIFWLLHIFFDGFFSQLNFIDRAQTYLPLLALIGAALVGLADDILGILHIGPRGGGLGMRHKLLLYTIIALLGGLWFYFKLDWNTINVPFLGQFAVGYWFLLYFVFIIVASAFSVNETDGLDGLAGGTSLFSFTALTVIAFVLDRFHLAAFTATLVGALLAFLWYNIYPARFFMGDTGSMALGITLGTVSLITQSALLLPFFAIIPVIESLSVIIQLSSKALRNGKKVFLSTPIHHHFEALGWVESQIVMRFWIISAIFTTLGLVLFFLNRVLL